MITTESLKIEKCAKCGHDIMASGDLVKHTNVKDGHRYFTQFCQVCKCDTPTMPRGGSGELTVEVKEPEKTRPEGTFTCRQCGEDFSSKQLLATHNRAKHRVDYEKIGGFLAQGKTAQEISLETGAPVTTVRGWIDRLKDQLHGTAESREQDGKSGEKGNGRPPETGTDPQGALKTRIEISRRESSIVFQNSQIRFIRDMVENLLESAPDGESIVMETRIFPGNVRRITVEISGEKKEAGS